MRILKAMPGEEGDALNNEPRGRRWISRMKITGRHAYRHVAGQASEEIATHLLEEQRKELGHLTGRTLEDGGAVTRTLRLQEQFQYDGAEFFLGVCNLFA